ncbi:MAG: flavin reductase family protein [Candidatus Omnitrophota bacterium]
MDKISIETSLQAYRLINPGVVFLVTSGNGDRDNIYAAAWNMPIRKEPGMLAILCDKSHYSFSLITETWEFGVNIPDASLVDAVYGCGATCGREVNKFSHFGLTRWKAQMITPPLIKEAIAHIECKVGQMVDLGDCVLFVAHMMTASVDPQHFKDNAWNFDNGLKLIHHIGGDRFAVSADIIKATKTQFF